MWLKVSTAALIFFSIIMLFAYFWIVGPKPPSHAPRAEQIAFLRKGASYIGLEALALIGSIVGSYLIARRAREEFREQSRKNMESLLEATLRDHARTSGQDVEAD